MIAVIDYGLGNVWSVMSALEYIGAKPLLTGDPEKIVKSEYLILPGVGSFRKGMLALHNKGIAAAIIEAVKTRGAKILGICLGMQMLGAHGTEDGETDGLGLVPNNVDKFSAKELGSENKIPHVGFNSVRFSEKAGIFQGLPDDADFYFTHSYRMLPLDLKGRIGICTYGVDFLAAFEVDNLCGTQFHPEKSQNNGLILIKNFLTK